MNNSNVKVNIYILNIYNILYMYNNIIIYILIYIYNKNIYIIIYNNNIYNNK